MSRKLLGFPHVEHTELYCEAQQWLAMHFVIAFWLATSMVVGKNYDPFRIWSRSLFMAVNLKPHRTHQVLRVQHQLHQQTEEERLAKKWGWVGNKGLFRCCYVFACCNVIAAANKQMIMSPPPTQFTVIANAIYEYDYYFYTQSCFVVAQQRQRRWWSLRVSELGMKLFHNYTFYASSHSLLWSTIFLAMPFMSLYLYQLHCVEKQASDPRSYAPEQQSRQRMSSRTLIIDMQWHKKDIIPRYDKFPLHLCVLAQFQFRSQPPPLFCPSVNCPE